MIPLQPHEIRMLSIRFDGTGWTDAPHVSLGQQDKHRLARFVIDGRAATHHFGASLPRPVRIFSPQYAAEFGPNGKPTCGWSLIHAVYESAPAELWINAGCDFFWKPAWLQRWKRQQEYRDGQASTGHRFGMFLHEAGHHASYKHLGRKAYYALVNDNEITSGPFRGLKNVWSRGERIIARQVSRRATDEPMELVAEVFAGRLIGKRYSPEVVALYHKYGGGAVPGGR